TLTVIKNNNHIKFEKIPELYGHVSIKVINASHDDVVSKMDSVGFIFDFKETVLIYTGDTGWTDIMKKQYHEISELYKSKDKILIAHMGGFKEEELEYLDSKDHNKLYYKNHLGRIGITGINETLKPNICLISEFGEEFKEGNSRIEIARIFNKAFNDNGYDITFLPADIGLKYDFIKKQIEVIKKTNFAKKEKTFSYIDAKGVNVLQLDKKDNSLHYYKVKKDSDTIKRYLEDEYDNSLK
ncbi:MAG: hypothetical protein HQK93_10445, partial [Nitrospirae bacterium]|nr:hypothetical protein [Nitrospirota bacterium]